MRRILYTLSFIIVTQNIFAQLADVHFYVRTDRMMHYEGGVGGNCWESGSEEYTGYGGFRDDVNTGVSWSSCQTCNNNGNCTYGQNVNIGNRISDAYRIDPFVDGWEDDIGARCSYNTSFFNDDDCRTGPGDRGDIFFREASFPSSNYAGGINSVGGFGDGDFRVWYDIYWFYTGNDVANRIVMSCTPQQATQTNGAIRSQSVYLTAGVPYKFETTSGNDTYLRLYAPDGYTIVAEDDDGAGVALLSLLTYTPTTTGWYYIETSDNFRSRLSISTTLEYVIDEMPNEPVANDVSVCEGENVTLTATPSATGTIKWYLTASSTPEIATGNSLNLGSTLMPGIYYRYVTEVGPAGCESSRREVAITVKPNPDAPTVADATICPGSSASLLANNPIGVSVAASNFNWYTSTTLTPVVYTGAIYNTSNLNTPPTSHTFYVAGVLDGCVGDTSSAVVDFYQADMPMASNDTSICDGDSITLSASASGATELRWYQNADLTGYIQSGNTFTTPSLNNSTTYYVTATYANGCESQAESITVSVSSLAQSPILTDDSYCESEDVVLNANNVMGTITWYSDAALTTVVGTGTPLNIGSQVAGTYNYFAQVNNGTCNSAVESNTIEVEANPSAPSLSPQTICEGETATLTVTSANNVNWYADAALNNLLFVGSSFTTPVLNANTTYYVTNSNMNCESSASSVLVTVNPKPTAPMAANDTICSNQSATLVAMGAGGTYTWYSDAALSNQVFVGASYTTPVLNSNTSFYVTEDNGICQGDATEVVVYINTDIVVTIDSVIDVLCASSNDGTIYITATGGDGNYSYTWTGGSTIEDLSNVSAGNYVVTVTDGFACTASNNASISSPDSLSVSIDNIQNVSCNGGSDGSVVVNVNGGTPPYSYMWSNGSSNQNLYNSTAGNYTLTVLDANSCQTMISASISENTVLSASITATDILCFGATGSASVSATGGNMPYTYLWSNFDSGSSASNLDDGVVSVIATDNNGCSIQVYDTIDGPAAAIEIEANMITNVSCFNASDGAISTIVSGGTAPYSYAWSPSGGNAANSSNLSAGNYTLTITDDNNCSASATFEVESPDDITATLSVTNPSCYGEETGIVVVGASGGTLPYTYNWNTTPTQTGAVAINLAGDTSYVVTIADKNGCTHQEMATLVNPTEMVVNTDPTNVSCISSANGKVSISVQNGNPPFHYELNGLMQSDTLFENLSPGNYIVYVEDNNNCTASASFSVNSVSGLEAELEASGNDLLYTIDDLYIVRGEEVNLNVNLINDNGNVVGYIWTPIEIDSSGTMQNPHYIPSQDISVLVEVQEDINGDVCSVYDSINIHVSQEVKTFIPTAFSPNNSGANNFFECNVLGAKNLDVQIFNRWGELIFANPNQGNGPSNPNDPSLMDGSNPRGAWDGKYNGEDLPTGAYAYKIEVTYFDDVKETISGSVTIIR